MERINHYAVDSATRFVITYPIDDDLSGRKPVESITHPLNNQALVFWGQYLQRKKHLHGGMQLAIVVHNLS